MKFLVFLARSGQSGLGETGYWFYFLMKVKCDASICIKVLFLYFHNKGHPFLKKVQNFRTCTAKMRSVKKINLNANMVRV